ncbi:MAG: hypothetical protein AABW89_04315 [Nanoarchaeota archaeon]
MNKKLFLLYILFIMGFIFQITSAQEVVGVSPAYYQFENVLRGGYAERIFRISTNSEIPLEVSIEMIGEVGSWIKIPFNSSIISKGSSWSLLASVEPPNYIPNGNYTGFIRISSRSTGSSSREGHATGAVISVLDVAVTVSITDIENLRCISKNIEGFSTEKGEDLIFSADVSNLGNVRIKPRVKIDLWDQEQISLIDTKEFVGSEVLPTREVKQIFKIPTKNMEIGQYWADIQIIECSDSSLLTIDVYTPGTLRAQGLLKDIIAPPIVLVEDTTTIEAIFENIGEKMVEARFKGHILFNDKIIQLLESEPLEVPISSSANFTFFFTPEREGRYVVVGRVLYDSKRTFESSKVIDVVTNGISLLKYLGYGIAMIIIIYLYLKIRHERRKLFG